jgi:ribosomal protein S20
LTKADKQVNKAIDSDDYDKIRKALSKADTEVDDAVDS